MRPKTAPGLGTPTGSAGVAHREATPCGGPSPSRAARGRARDACSGLYRIGAQPLWVDEASSLRFARQRSASSGVGAHSSIPGTRPSTTRFLHGWLVLRRRRGERCDSCRRCSVCSRSRSCTRSGGRSATIGSGWSARSCSRSPRSRSGTRRRRGGMPSLTLGATCGDVGRRLPPSPPGALRERARVRLGVARLRRGHGGRAPRARHGGVPADRGERADAGVVVDT